MILKYREPIIVDITDLYGFQRKAEYATLIDNTRTQTTVISVFVKWFKDGVEVIDNVRGIRPYQKEIIADNETLVDTTTGLIVMSKSQFYQDYQEPDINEDGLEIGKKWKEGTPTHYMGESDFYTYIRDNVDVKLKDLIIQAITRAADQDRL